MRMCNVTICVLPGSTVVFHIISQKTGFSKKKKVVKCKICFDFSINFSEMCLILRRTERDVIKNVYRSSCKVNVILVRF